MKLFSLCGVAVASTQAPEILLGQLVLNSDKEPTKITYTIPDSMQANIRTYYKVDNFVALKKSYSDAGLLIDISSFKFSDHTKTVLTFNTPASRNKFLNYYRDNISNFKNA